MNWWAPIVALAGTSNYAAGRIDIVGVFTGLVVLAILGMSLNAIVKAIEGRLAY